MPEKPEKADKPDALAGRLTELLEPVVDGAGLFLERIETTRAGKYSVVRVVVDLPDGPGDLDLDRLGEVTAAVSQALDEADPVKGQYTLEVSTPGAERELRTARHFRRAVGHGAQVSTDEEELSGTITAVDDQVLTLQTDAGPRTVPLEQVRQARMVVSGP
ncbi:ribosome maturation factor RimP [Actinomyces capricornis]|uniref:Ribosome maturation factor RimP n=1 Tax=Actinomyces capricornis TaxID=2755559 RepID=A0ABN6K169_9ACTO|nr:ribosome maturation factor RimP [Actinomyces capricornis]BDA63323.1 ribosome maturation factor RimP [Actinomyces capricornis]